MTVLCAFMGPGGFYCQGACGAIDNGLVYFLHSVGVAVVTYLPVDGYFCFLQRSITEWDVTGIGQSLVDDPNRFVPQLVSARNGICGDHALHGPEHHYGK